jgi:hypothetical protein
VPGGMQFLGCRFSKVILWDWQSAGCICNKSDKGFLADSVGRLVVSDLKWRGNVRIACGSFSCYKFQNRKRKRSLIIPGSHFFSPPLLWWVWKAVTMSGGVGTERSSGLRVGA